MQNLSSCLASAHLITWSNWLIWPGCAPRISSLCDHQITQASGVGVHGEGKWGLLPPGSELSGPLIPLHSSTACSSCLSNQPWSSSSNFDELELPLEVKASSCFIKLVTNRSHYKFHSDLLFLFFTQI